MIDVITNSSTEIFSMATKTGINQIENLIKSIIKTFDMDIEYSDVIKGIYISPSDLNKQYCMCCMYLKKYKSELIPTELSVILDDYTSLYDLFDNFYGDLKKFIISMIDGIENINDIYIELDYINFSIYEINKYNDTNYDYPMETDYNIIVNDEKYQDLANKIHNILNNYTQSASYC